MFICVGRRATKESSFVELEPNQNVNEPSQARELFGSFAALVERDHEGLLSISIGLGRMCIFISSKFHLLR